MTFITDMTLCNRIEAVIQPLAGLRECNPNPVLELSAEGKLNYSNEAARQMAEFDGKSHPFEILPVDAKTIVEGCLATGCVDHRYETTKDARIVAWSFIPAPDREAVHCYARAVTVQPFADAHLGQGQTRQSIAHWAEGIAHELNNILTLIQSNASFLLTEKKLDKEASDSTRQICAAVHRAAGLTEKLLVLGVKPVREGVAW